MSAMSDLDKLMSEVTPLPGEAIDDLARRLFNIQTEFYSAHCGSDLLSYEFNFDTIPAKHREAWIRSAQRKMESKGEGSYA